MSRGRLEAFSDGVIAIIITIMVLEMKVPHAEAGQEAGLVDLLRVRWVFLSYVLSFVYLGIYWNNHHHLMHTVDRVDGRIMWANLNLLFWLSLVPFATGWLGENHFQPVPTATYGFALLCPAIAWTILQAAIVAAHGPSSKLRAAIGRDRKGKISLAAYASAIPLALFASPWISVALYVGVALLWLVPDRRIAGQLGHG